MKRERTGSIDFIIIGAAKAGTTWLADVLREHPDIFIPELKELHYFNPTFPDDHSLANLNHEKPIEWYLNFFKGAKPNQIKGEATPAYLWDEAAAENIYQFDPNLKLIAVLREPVERAFSQYLYRKFRGLFADMDFNQAIQEREDFLRMGLYHKHLTRFYNRFPKENIQVLLFDDLKEDNRAFLREVERFLGVREYIPDSIDKASNVTGVPRFGLANKLIFRFRVFARKRNLSVVTEFLRLSGLSKLSRLVMRKNTKPFDSKPKLTEANQKKLKDYYREDIAQLERLIERDLSGWKQ